MKKKPISRRDFVKASAAAAAAGLVTGPARAIAPGAWAGASDTIRIGLIGCGGRGRGAAVNSIKSSEGVTLTALGDVFQGPVDYARDWFSKANLGEGTVDLDDDSCFTGLDAYKNVIHHPEVDVVLMATPPGFRPLHLAELVTAGKHGFIEKPVCVDPVGYRSILASAKVAREKGLSIVGGTQFRRSNNYIDAMRAIHDGKIGDIVFAQARYCSGGIWYREREQDMADAHYQIHNWYHFLWTCGDQIVEQAIHNIDAMNWAMGGPPKSAYGHGGQRTRPDDSEIYDSMTIDYEYPNGAVVSFMCRQHAGRHDVSNRVVGTKGVAVIMPFDIGKVTTHGGETLVRTRYKGDSYVQEHTDLIAAIRAGDQIVEAEEVADSSLTAVLGRMAAYTGEKVNWDFAAKESKLDTMPANLSLASELAPRETPVPGTETLV